MTIDQHRLDRVEERHDNLAKAVGLVAEGLAGHVAGCNATGEIVVNRIARLELVVIGAVMAMLTGLGSALWYVLTHSIRLVVAPAVALMIVMPALAHEDDPVLRELMSPVTGGSCCHERDCKLVDQWDLRQGQYFVKIEGEWKPIPSEIVIRDKGPHPTGQAVLCKNPLGEDLCFLPGATGV